MQFKIRKAAGRRATEKGAVQVEFALVALTLFLVMFGIVEMERMLLVYTTLANSAKAGVRYAIVHGSNRHSTGIKGPSSAGDHSNVDAVVTELARGGTLNPARLTVNVTYTACNGCTSSNQPGSQVSVQAVYAYDPFGLLPLSVNLQSGSSGIITF